MSIQGYTPEIAFLVHGIAIDEATAFSDALVAASALSKVTGRAVRVVPRSKSWFILVVSLFFFWRRRAFIDDMTTTITLPLFGSWVFLPDRLFNKREARAILAHEFQHVVDAYKFTPLGFMFMYLFCLPVLWTARAWLEWRAYRKQIEEYICCFGSFSEEQANQIADSFVDSSYLFMSYGREKWRKKVELFVNEALLTHCAVIMHKASTDESMLGSKNTVISLANMPVAGNS